MTAGRAKPARILPWKGPNLVRNMIATSAPWLAAAAILGALPASASAHERWFVPTDEQPPTDWGRLFSLPVAIALISGLSAVAGLRWLERRLDDPLWPRPPFFQRMEPASAAILGVQAAIAMIFAASGLHLFVPNIDLPRNVGGVLVAGLSTLAAFTFITGVMTRTGAVLTIGLVLFGFAYTSPERVAEQVMFIGIALYLAIVGREVTLYADRGSRARTAAEQRLRPYALPALRICAGLSILVLGCTEKLLNPRLGVLFLERYPRFNVPRDAGFDWMTDRRFVLLIGIVEATAGMTLIAGFLPRVVILGLWIPFNLGIAFLPPQELIGHLPILATMYVLLVRGSEGIPPRAFDAGRSAPAPDRPPPAAGVAMPPRSPAPISP
ncbi:MAG: hypothetical protein ACR2OO_17655 [Thermomicrobiales bacterium]